MRSIEHPPSRTPFLFDSPEKTLISPLDNARVGAPLTLYETWNVVPEDGAWTVRSETPPVISSRHESKNEALRVATRLALEDRPSQVVVHSVRGNVTQCVIYDTDRSPADEPFSPDLEDTDPSRRVPV